MEAKEFDPSVLDNEYRRKLVLRIATASKFEGNCLKWQNRPNSKGEGDYGQIRVLTPQGHGLNKTEQHLVHRVVYGLHSMEVVPSEIQISHLCHNSLCVLFEHLCPETAFVNANRRICKINGFCHKDHHSNGKRYN